MERNLKRVLGLLAGAGVVLWLAGPAQAAAGQPRSLFDTFVVAGGLIGWILIVMDVASIAFIIEQFINTRRGRMLPPDINTRIRIMFEAKQYREVIEYTASHDDFLSQVVHAALNEASHGYAAMERAMEEAIEERTTRLLRRVEVLNIFGNVAPMMGLLGTVYGMIMTFNAIVKAGGLPDAAGLADGVGTALVTTFWGLIVAIPALAVYGYMRNRIDGMSAETALTAQELIGTFRPGRQKNAAQPPSAG